jgi:dihydroflavonol-4-reductase
VVYHLAAMLAAPWHPDFLKTNADGVRLILEACAARAKPPRVVLVSSLAAAGPANGAPRREEEPPTPVSRYGISKLGGESAARALADRLPITIVRPPLVFGPGDEHLLPAYRAAKRGIGVVYSAHAYSMIHVEDLATMLRVAALQGERCTADAASGAGVYFAADERPLDQAGLWRALGLAVGRRVRLVRLPAAAIRVAGAVAEVAGRLGGPSLWSRDKALEATVGSWTCSPAKIRGLGWTPAAGLEQRLDETGAWYRAQGLL